MFTFLIASKRIMPAVVAVLVVVDVVIGTCLLTSDLSKSGLLPKGVGFGFYKTDEVKG